MHKILSFFIKLFLYFIRYTKVLSDKIYFKHIDTIDYLIKSKKSLIRWGDGETELLLGGSINFQNGSLSIMKSFYKIIKNYNDKSNYIFALPLYYMSMSDDKLRKIDKLHFWYKIKYLYKFIFNTNMPYLDAFIFREESEISTLDIEKLWIDSKDIIFIHNNYKYYTDFSDKYNNSKCHFIEITSCNSISQSNNIIKKVNDLIVNENIDNQNLKILISAGPASKIVIYELSLKKLICYDMGHFFDYKFYGLRREWKDNQLVI